MSRILRGTAVVMIGLSLRLALLIAHIAIARVNATSATGPAQPRLRTPAPLRLYTGRGGFDGASDPAAPTCRCTVAACRRGWASA